MSNLLENLEYGIKDTIENAITSNINPFFKKKKINDILITDMSLNELSKHFNRVLILRYHGKVPELIWNNTIDKCDLEYLCKHIYIDSSNLNILRNKLHKRNITILSNKYLKLLINNDLIFNEKELILPLFEIENINIKNYINQYDSLHTLEDYIQFKLLNKYNQVIENISFNIGIISNLKGVDYWSNINNCQCNITLNFINRQFNCTTTSNDEKILETLDDLKNLNVEDSYFSNIYRKQEYVDASNNIKKKGFKLYYLNSISKITCDDINLLLKMITHPKERYYLIMYLLSSKDYCHLIINNINTLNIIQNEFGDKYQSCLRYVMGYVWVTLYLEECIKKTFINQQDRFVFDINTASKLPKFQFNHNNNNNFRYNPYLSVLISTKVLNPNKNVIGINSINSFSYGINNLDEFHLRMNIFISSNKNINIFDKFNWDNVAISGSIMAACIPNNPLILLFSRKTTEESFDYFCKEYYSSADIDMMCNLPNDFDYINKAYQVYDQLVENTNRLLSNNITEIIPFKNVVIMTDIKFISTIATEKYSVEYIISNLDNNDVKKLFEKYYYDYLIQKNKKYINSKYWRDKKYNDYFDILPIICVRIIVINNETENHLFKVYDSLKFKIKFSKLSHHIEFFKIKSFESDKCPSFFSTVSKFHLPCVRSYYTGDNVYMLPSAITAYLTLINFEYKYFAGAKDPIEILNKYRMRGYSIYLNDKEKVYMSEYCKKITKWKILLDDNNYYFGPLNLNDILFNLSSNSEIRVPNVEYNHSILMTEFEKKMGLLNTINNAGYIIPLKKWIIDAAYEMDK